VSFQVRIPALAHEGLLGLKVPFRVIAEKCDGLLDAMLPFAVQDLVVQAMGGVKETAVLAIDRVDADQVIVRPVSHPVVPALLAA
jgi:hypothetical protein